MSDRFNEKLRSLDLTSSKNHKVPKQTIAVAKAEIIRTSVDIPIVLRQKIDTYRSKHRVKFREFCILAFESYLKK